MSKARAMLVVALVMAGTILSAAETKTAKAVANWSGTWTDSWTDTSFTDTTYGYSELEFAMVTRDGIHSDTDGEVVKSISVDYRDRKDKSTKGTVDVSALNTWMDFCGVYNGYLYFIWDTTVDSVIATDTATGEDTVRRDRTTNLFQIHKKGAGFLAGEPVVLAKASWTGGPYGSFGTQINSDVVVSKKMVYVEQIAYTFSGDALLKATTWVDVYDHSLTVLKKTTPALSWPSNGGARSLVSGKTPDYMFQESRIQTEDTETGAATITASVAVYK